ncbi:general substrate transporter [Flammula alnicola]|nr:general substrate transporter [Flammula alnicola]
MSTHSPEKSSQPDHVSDSEKFPSPVDIPQNAKFIEVANVDLAAALANGPQLKATSARSIQLFLILLVAFMGSLSNGFDGSVMSAVNGMSQYLDYFGIDGQDAGGGVGTTTAIIFGIYSIGSIAGVLVAGPVTDRFGRRGGMALGSLIIIIGAVVITVARNVHYLLGGRFTLGFGVAISTTAAPAYVVEMSPPQWRGRLTGLYNTFYYSGSILCTGLTVATNRINSTASWRAPLAIQIIPASILLSPRWLIAVGRKEEARKVLAKYHGNGNPDAPLVLLEWKEFEEGVKLDASDKRWWDYSELFNTRNARYRTSMMLLMGFFGQWSGNGLGYFLPILFGAAGVDSQNQRLTLNFANTIISATGALIGTSLTDKVGRRTMWFWGTLASSGMLAVVTGCTAKWGSSNANPQGANAAIAFIFLFGFVYSLAYTPLQALYPAECLDYNTRAKGMAFYAFAVSCASFVNTYAGPIALKNITWRAPNPVKASITKYKVAVVEKGGATELVIAE